MWPFKKYRNELPFIRKIVKSDRDLMTFDPTTAQHLFSTTKMSYCGAADCYSEDKIQNDYYKSPKGNYVVLIRSLKKSDRVGDVEIRCILEKQLIDDYVQAYKYPEVIHLLVDNYHHQITYKEL